MNKRRSALPAWMSASRASNRPATNPKAATTNRIGVVGGRSQTAKVSRTEIATTPISAAGDSGVMPRILSREPSVASRRSRCSSSSD